MKKNVLVIAGLAVLSTNAFASKARMTALQQGSASYYINDTRSVFLNPASVVDNKNYILVEAGTHAAGVNGATNPEGGFFREMGSISYGLYLGNNGGSELVSHTTAVAGVPKYLAQANGVDLFVGGDMGMKWGANFHMSSQSQEVNPTDNSALGHRKNDSMGIGLGVVHGDMEGYAHLGLNDKSVGSSAAATNTEESKITGDMKIGGSYKLNGWTLFADYSAAKLQETSATDTKASEIVVGAGRSHEIAAGARLFTDVSYSVETTEVAQKVTITKLPITIGVEADATSWLTLRGSIHQALTGNYKHSVVGKTVPETGAMAAGATLNFGKLKIDGTLTNTGVGTLGTNDTISNMALSYNF